MARVASLDRAKNAVQPVLKDIGEHMAPYRGRWQTEAQDQRGRRKGLKIINGTANRAFNILSSGMMAGLTSPGRPWFKLTTQDPDLAEFTPVRQWLDDVARAMRGIMAQSNLYNVLPSVYGELAPFGTTALLEVEDPASVIRFYPFTIGSFGIAQDDRLVVDTMSRPLRMTIRQVVGRFGTVEAVGVHAAEVEAGRRQARGGDRAGPPDLPEPGPERARLRPDRHAVPRGILGEVRRQAGAPAPLRLPGARPVRAALGRVWR